MFDRDLEPFAKLLSEVWDLWPNAKPLNSAQATMFFRALAEYPLEDVRAGLDAHVKDAQRGKWPPSPADVIAQIEQRIADDGRPGPEEAWAISQRSADENLTLIWTKEMAEAWGKAKPILQVGDEVGARMAFREIYTRLVAAARAAGKPPAWYVTLGHDPQEREETLQRSVALGRLLPPAQQDMLPAPDDSGQVPLIGGRSEHPPLPGGAITGLGQLIARAPAWVRERLQKHHDELVARGVRPAHRAGAEASVDPEEDAKRTEELRRISTEKYERYLEEQERRRQLEQATPPERGAHD